MSALYDRDFNLWIQKTASDLKSKDMDAIDWNNSIDEIEGIGKSERRALQSYLERLIEHLLKRRATAQIAAFGDLDANASAYWEAEKERCQRGWKIEINEFRSRIERILEDSPSLKNYLEEIYSKIHNLAVARMSIAFELPTDASISKDFALSKEFSDEQI